MFPGPGGGRKRPSKSRPPPPAQNPAFPGEERVGDQGEALFSSLTRETSPGCLRGGVSSQGSHILRSNPFSPLTNIPTPPAWRIA